MWRADKEEEWFGIETWRGDEETEEEWCVEWRTGNGRRRRPEVKEVTTRLSTGCELALTTEYGDTFTT